jgi:hypothetical protein
MDIILKAIGVLVSLASILSFIDPTNLGFHLPVVFALGCVIFALGEICARLGKKT